MKYRVLYAAKVGRVKGFGCPSCFLPLCLGVLFPIALSAVGGCFLYTDNINHPPENVLIEGPQGQSRNMPISFKASAYDPDGDPLAYEWAHKTGPCVDGEAMPPVEASGTTFQVVVTDLGKFCVWLNATDQHGATAKEPAKREAMAVNTAPTASIARQQPGGNALGPFPLYSDFRFSAAGSTDPDRDEVTREWALAAFPDQSRAMLVDCAPTEPRNMAACFHADTKGDYRVTLTVSDGILMNQQALLVTVADDGDPWPEANPSYAVAGFPAFTWRIRRNGAAWQTLTGFNLPTLSVPAGELSVGDVADVRVEVADRILRSLATCGDEPACRLAPNCAQRLTWTVAFQ